MANPQKENGYTAIANELFEALCRIRVNGEARQVLDVVFRKTYGFNKKEDRIALSQFVDITGLKKQTVCKALNKLKYMNLIVVTQKGNAEDNIFNINKDYTTWKPLPKKVTNKGKVLVGRINTKELKQSIRERDENTCKVCGYNGNVAREKLHVHHIDFNQGNNDQTNLITLCKSCHGKAHNYDPSHKEYLMSLISQKGNSIPLPKKEKSVTQNANSSLPKKGHTKDNTTKVDTKERELLPPATTPADEARNFFSGGDNFDKTFNWLKSKGLDEKLIKQELSKFVTYWTEKNPTGRKERWQMEKTFEIRKRLATWLSRVKQFSGLKSVDNQKVDKF